MYAGRHIAGVSVPAVQNYLIIPRNCATDNNFQSAYLLSFIYMMTGSKPWPFFRSPELTTTIRITSKHFSPISAALRYPSPSPAPRRLYILPINWASEQYWNYVHLVPQRKASSHYIVDLFAGTVWSKTEHE